MHYYAFLLAECNYANLLFFVYCFVKTSIGVQICVQPNEESPCLQSLIVLLNIMCLGIKCLCNFTRLCPILTRRWRCGAISCTETQSNSRHKISSTLFHPVSLNITSPQCTAKQSNTIFEMQFLLTVFLFLFFNKIFIVINANIK